MYGNELAGGRQVIRAAALCFTDEGEALAGRVPGLRVLRHGRDFQNTKTAAAALFETEQLIIFVCAVGIAVRSVAGCLRSKAEDPAVVVMDDAGQYVIPILSGHLGGANGMSRILAGYTGGLPVITTASDNRQRDAVDTRAKRGGYRILDMAAARRFTAALLKGETVKVERGREKIVLTMPAEGNGSPEEMILTPKEYVLGVGCRRGCDPGDLKSFVLDRLAAAGIDERDLYAVCSIDRKAEEEAIQRLAKDLRCPFAVYTAEQLNALEGQFTGSAFVAETVGTDNVCERSAAAGCGGRPEEFVIRKTAENGMTLAVARRTPDPEQF